MQAPPGSPSLRRPLVQRPAAAVLGAVGRDPDQPARHPGRAVPRRLPRRGARVLGGGGGGRAGRLRAGLDDVPDPGPLAGPQPAPPRRPLPAPPGVRAGRAARAFWAAGGSGVFLARAASGCLSWAPAPPGAASAARAWGAPPAAPARAAAQATQPRGFAGVLRDRVMAAFMLVVLGQMVVYQQGFTTLPIAMHAAGLAPRGYGLVMAVNGIVIVIVQPLAGPWLSRRDQ